MLANLLSIGKVHGCSRVHMLALQQNRDDPEALTAIMALFQQGGVRAVP